MIDPRYCQQHEEEKEEDEQQQQQGEKRSLAAGGGDTAAGIRQAKKEARERKRQERKATKEMNHKLRKGKHLVKAAKVVGTFAAKKWLKKQAKLKRREEKLGHLKAVRAGGALGAKDLLAAAGEPTPTAPMFRIKEAVASGSKLFSRRLGAACGVLVAFSAPSAGPAGAHRA